MIRTKVKEFFFNFFLHIEINTLNNPYKLLPRPHGTNGLSRVFKTIFEKSWIRKAFGLQLASAMIVIPVITNGQLPITSEAPIVVTHSELISTYLPEDPNIVTKPRQFVMPVVNFKYIGQSYHPGHLALDLNADLGSSIRSFSNGKVFKVEDGIFGYGRHIIIDHGNDLFSLYAHMQNFDVTIGDYVEAGQKIGEVGMTGRTTGPHLHFEVHDGTRPVNPKQYLKLN